MTAKDLVSAEIRMHLGLWDEQSGPAIHGTDALAMLSLLAQAERMNLAEGAQLHAFISRRSQEFLSVLPESIGLDHWIPAARKLAEDWLETSLEDTDRLDDLKDSILRHLDYLDRCSLALYEAARLDPHRQTASGRLIRQQSLAGKATSWLARNADAFLSAAGYASALADCLNPNLRSNSPELYSLSLPVFALADLFAAVRQHAAGKALTTSVFRDAIRAGVGHPSRDVLLEIAMQPGRVPLDERISRHLEEFRCQRCRWLFWSYQTSQRIMHWWKHGRRHAQDLVNAMSLGFGGLQKAASGATFSSSDSGNESRKIQFPDACVEVLVEKPRYFDPTDVSGDTCNLRLRAADLPTGVLLHMQLVEADEVGEPVAVTWQHLVPVGLWQGEVTVSVALPLQECQILVEQIMPDQLTAADAPELLACFDASLATEPAVVRQWRMWAKAVQDQMKDDLPPEIRVVLSEMT